jgi:regulatory protein
VAAGRAGSGEIHQAALRLLSRRAYSARELTERLTRRGFTAAAINAEIHRLDRSGLLNEAALAEAVVRDTVRRGFGRRGVAASLRRRMVGGEETSAALSGFGEEEEEKALRVALARSERRYPRWRELPEERRKVIRYLLARGFGAALVRDTLSAAEGESGEQEEGLERGDPQDVS